LTKKKDVKRVRTLHLTTI